MPFAIQTFPDGSSERVFYADPEPLAAPQNQDSQHDSVQVDGGVIHMDGDLDKPFVITKTLTQAQKYMTCKTDEDAEQFSVNGIGQVICQDVGCQEVEATQSVSVGPSNDKILLASVDTDDVRVYKNLYMEPSGNPAVHPMIMTRGSIVTLQDGFFGFVPTEGQQQIPGHVYRLGRQENIGDLTHDNDGLNMRKTSANQDDANETLTHRVHICPDPTDPSVLICSKKHVSQNGFNYEGDYIQCRNVGPEKAPTDRNVVFRVDQSGAIQSEQMDELNQDRYQLLSDVSGMLGQLETLDDKVDANESNIRYDLVGIGDRILNNETDIVDIKTSITSLNTDVDGLVTDVLQNHNGVTSLASQVSDNSTNITNNAAVIATNTSSITTAESDITSIETSVAAHATAIAALQSSSGGGGLPKLDLVTLDSKDIATNGDYDDPQSWGSSSSPITVPWGDSNGDPVSLTIFVRKMGAMYLPNPNDVNLEFGNIVTIVFAPRTNQNCSLTVKVHDSDEAFLIEHNQYTPRSNMTMFENRVAKFVYLGLHKDRQQSLWYNHHRWILKYLD